MELLDIVTAANSFLLAGKYDICLVLEALENEQDKNILRAFYYGETSYGDIWG